ncbi:hypothetical protein HK104_001117 [Borealophlyctis nickersoniae]|nr:hypothetical protein HK104_001117 [Borealophlyctis nickersoniae]
MAPAELDGDPVDVEMDGIVETAEGRTALGTEVKDGGGGKRTRAEEDGGAAGGSEARNGGPAPASKKRKPQTTTHLTANSPTLLLVCNVEIDILRSILSRLRSRFDYLFLGFTCKQLYNTIIQTQMHCQWFTQYMNEGWFSTFDAETEVKKVHPIRRMTVDDASVVRCNFRNVETVSDFCKMDTFDGGNCSFEWVASLVADDAEDCLDRLKGYL